MYQLPPMSAKPIQAGGALQLVRPIPNWILLGGGYRQTEADYDQGMFALARYLHERFAGPNLRVEYLHWDDDPAAKADWIFGCAAGPNAKIQYAGYSWDIGNFLPPFGRQLIHRGMKLAHVTSADGVYHHGGRLMHKIGLAQLIACSPRPWGRPQIALPRCVDADCVDWYVQDRGNFGWFEPDTWLRGHDLVWADDGSPVLGRHNVPNVLHHWMDEGERFQQRVIEVAEHLFGEVRAC